MSDEATKRRLSGQDLSVVIAVAAISVLGIGALSGTEIYLSLIIIIFAVAILLIYGLWKVPDITGQNFYNKHAQSEEEYLVSQANIADGITDAVTMIDARQRVIYANPAAQALLNINNLGRPLSTYVREAGVRDVVTQALGGERPEPLSYKIENPTERHIRVIASPFTSDYSDNPRAMALCFFYDITDYMFLDSQRADFLANASHELKTPVASILGYIETLQGHAKDDPKAREKFLAIMKSQGERMQRLISDLLSLLRIEQIEHQAPSGKADMQAALVTAIEAVEPTATKRSVTVKYTPSKVPLVRGDQDEIVQLILNLLDNAVRISEPSSVIELSLSLNNQRQVGAAFLDSEFSEDAQSRRIVLPPPSLTSCIIFKIRDYGPGFSRDHLPRIGERFYRIAGDLSSKEKGTGLGLAIVKHIIIRHRGGLFIKSGIGEGTEFVAMLPPYNTETLEE